MNDRFVEITSGLLPGDEVVTRGAYSLAFAGKGSVRLKAALDAAHGHEHNEDGSELKPGEKSREARGEGDEHGHDEGNESARRSIFPRGKWPAARAARRRDAGARKEADDEPAPAKAKAEQPPTAEAKH